MAPGPAISGMASGNAAMWRTCSSRTACAASLPSRSLLQPSTMSKATANSAFFEVPEPISHTARGAITSGKRSRACGKRFRTRSIAAGCSRMKSRIMTVPLRCRSVPYRPGPRASTSSA